MLSQQVSTSWEDIIAAITDILEDETSTEHDFEALRASIPTADELDVVQQLKWLNVIARGPLEKRKLFLSKIISLGDDETRLKLLSEIYHVESKEPRGSEISTINGHGPQSALDSPSAVYCILAEEVVDQFEEELGSITDKKGNNILHLAVHNGTRDILKAVLGVIKLRRPKELDGLVKGWNSKDETPLEMASMGNETPLVELLAEFDDEKRDDHVLKAARQGKLKLLQILLRGQELNVLLTTNVLEAVAKSQEDGRDEVWKFITQTMPDLEPDIGLLNIAITNCQMEIVRLILSDYPMLLGKIVNEKIESSAAHYASQGITEERKEEIIRKANTQAKKRFSELGKTTTQSKSQFLQAEEAKIRKYLENAPKAIQGMVLDKMVRKLSIHRIKLLWPKEDGKTKEACLDLNLLNSRNGGFARFINTAKREVDELSTPPADTKTKNLVGDRGAQSKENTIIDTETTNARSGRFRAEFHPILKYVAFPDLDEIRQNSPGNMDGLAGKEVKIVLDWLWIVKGVRKIIELRVPDSRYESCSEEMIENAAIEFSVEELNWKRIDLSTRGLREAESKVEILHLYSSGSWTPLCHWMGEEGLTSLSKLRTVHISIIEDNVTSQRAEDQRSEMEKWLKGHKPFILLPTPDIVDAPTVSSVKCIKWKRAGPKKPDHGIPDISRYPSRVTKLKNFLDYYRKRQRGLQKRDQLEPMKVAIIDTGVDESDFNTDIHKDGFKGESFVQRDDMESHWWLSSDAHGTQMAKIISSIDPFCQLYIAKVGDYKDDISVDRVAKAIKWAADKDVDIISMSFALNKQGKDLINEVANAALTKGIVLICSSADEGNNQPEVWPASYKETIDIAACDEMGYLAPYSNVRAKYYFQGQKIIADASQFTDSRDEIGGSSVSTALAAGVASLILACCKIDGVDVIKLKRREMIEYWFDEMKGKDLKYVRPWVVFGDGQREPKFKNMFLPTEARAGI